MDKKLKKQKTMKYTRYVHKSCLIVEAKKS